MLLGVLDQSPIREGGTAADALRETIELARRTEQFGYERFWVAEHHGSAALASSAPEILIGQIAARTSAMKTSRDGRT